MTAILLGLWALFYLIRKFKPKNKSADDQCCSRGCDCWL